MCFAHLCDAVGTDLGQAGAEVQAGFDPLLPLAPVAEPDSDHLLLQMEAFGYPGYFLGGRLTFFHKAALQSLLSSQAAVGREGKRREDELYEASLYGMHCILCSLRLIPDSCSPFPLPLIHSYFITVQGCGQEKKYVVASACYKI